MKYDTDSRDFEVIRHAYRSSPKSRVMDEGYIIRHDGELFFVTISNNDRDFEDCIFWSELERYYVYDELETDFYTYFDIHRREVKQ